MHWRRWWTIAVCAALLVGTGCSTRSYDLRDREWSGHGSGERFRSRRQRWHRRRPGFRRSVEARCADQDHRRDRSVVAPGLIELHTHGEDSLNYRYRAMDGITTMLDTERGTVDVDGGTPIGRAAPRQLRHLGRAQSGQSAGARRGISRISFCRTGTNGESNAGAGRANRIAGSKGSFTRSAWRRADAFLHAGRDRRGNEAYVRGGGRSCRHRLLCASPVYGSWHEGPAGRRRRARGSPEYRKADEGAAARLSRQYQRSCRHTEASRHDCRRKISGAAM